MQTRTFLFCLLLSLGAMAQQASPVSYWLTTADQSALLQEGKIQWQTNVANNAIPTISIDEQQRFQTIDGFGYTLTGGSAQLLYQLPKAQRQTLLQELEQGTFGTPETNYYYPSFTDGGNISSVSV